MLVFVLRVVYLLVSLILFAGVTVFHIDVTRVPYLGGILLPASLDPG